MEIHSVLPEERARTEKGETLPWGYRYADTAKNPRQPEESGPFGRNRSIRYTSSAGRRASTRQGTTPSRTKENSAVNDFSRLFAKEQAAQTQTSLPPETTDSPAPERVPTECLIYGYANKQSEWKVLSRYERIVSPAGMICEDYAREDPMLFEKENTGSPIGFNRNNIVVHKHLSKEALAKSRVYKGGSHWIKVTFDSWEAAERACFYSPVEIEGCLVHCEMWSGKGPLVDAPVPRGVEAAGGLMSATKARTVGVASGKASAVAGFEQALGMVGTLPRSHTLPDVQYGQPGTRDDLEVASSTTASSATATNPQPLTTALDVRQPNGSSLRSRSVPHLPSQQATIPTSNSEYMSRAPQIRKIVLKPISEALPPQQSLTERVLRTLPVVSWLLGYNTPAKKDDAKGGKDGLIGEGPVVKEDGTWDDTQNGWYWKLWYTIDSVLGTDFCGLQED